jgi:hypothetical protein
MVWTIGKTIWIEPNFFFFREYNYESTIYIGYSRVAGML